MGCYLFSVMIKEFLPIQCCDYWVLPRQLVWIWALSHSVGLKMDLNMGFTSSVGLNMGFTPCVVCLKGFIPISGLFEGLYPHQWFVWRALPRQCFDSSPEMLPPIKNAECLYCGVGLLPFWTCPILSQRSYHYTILWVSYVFIHSCICNMHTNIIHAWLHYQSYF